MTEKALAIIVLGALVVAVGLAIAWGTSRRYRRELGMKQETQEKTPDVSFIIGAFQDVTRQLKEKEKELERLKALAESRAENILQCVSNGVIAFDGNGRVNTVNRAAEELLGMAGEEITGKTCGEIFGDGELCSVIQETLRDRVASRRMETALLRKGERVWLGFNTALLTDRQGTSVGAILSFSDLTEVKRLQEQIELKERLTALGEMSAGIAHELRNPMAVIAGYLKLLARDRDEAGQAIIRDISAEIDTMNRIIGDLLTFARPTALNRVECNIRELIETIVASILQARGAGAEIRTVLRVEDVPMTIDEGLMRQALGNVIQNAVDAMPDGGTLTIEASGNHEAGITIRDTGGGIAPEHIKKIFLPFFTTRDQGVGMGLALAHKIISSHGGRIDVRSETGKGTVFTVTLPKE
jgi:PAS domain S-box-containing protein